MQRIPQKRNEKQKEQPFEMVSALEMTKTKTGMNIMLKK